MGRSAPIGRALMLFCSAAVTAATYVRVREPRCGRQRITTFACTRPGSEHGKIDRFAPHCIDGVGHSGPGKLAGGLPVRCLQ